MDFTEVESSGTITGALHELVLRRRERRVVGGARVPFIDGAPHPGAIRLHEGHTLPFQRVGNQNLGAVCHRPECLEHALELAEIVAVAALDVPAERAKLCLEITEVDDFADRLVRLKLVVINDYVKVAQAVLNRVLQRLEILTFLQLSVSGQHEHSPTVFGVSLCPGHTATFGDSHPK